MKYKVTVTSTADGRAEYMQIISEDQFSTNIVLIGEFELNVQTSKDRPGQSSKTKSRRAAEEQR